MTAVNEFEELPTLDQLLNVTIKMPNGNVIGDDFPTDYESHLRRVVYKVLDRWYIEEQCLYWWQRIALRLGIFV